MRARSFSPRAVATVLAVAAAGAVAACSSSSPALPGADATSVAPETSAPSGVHPLAEGLCRGAHFERGAEVVLDVLDELSGLGASRLNPGVLWAISDSGGPSQLVALDLEGRALAVVTVEGQPNVDWEAITLLDGPPRIVVGDTGDNRRERDRVALVVVDEPRLDPVPAGAGPAALSVSGTRWELEWPDRPRDAEALLTEPGTGRMYLLSKELLGASAVAAIPADAGPAAPTTLKLVGRIETELGDIVTGGDAFDDGSVVLRTYRSLLVFRRSDDGSVPGALAGEACRVVGLDEPQGEAVAVLPDGSALVTRSEGAGQPLWRITPEP